MKTPISHVIVVKKLDDPNNLAVGQVFMDVSRWCLKHEIPMLVHGIDNAGSEVDRPGDPVVVAIGGDGTVIYASKLAWCINAPVIGFNLGKVGFLADFSPHSVDHTMTAAMDGNLVLERRDTIMFEQPGVPALIDNIAINEIAVSCAQSDTTFKYDLLVGDAFAGTHMANGVLFSTPTGSTAYSLGVGGALIMPSCTDLIQITPIAPQTLSSRALIVGGRPGITIRFHVKPTRPITVRVDGTIVATYEASTKEPEYMSIDIGTAPEKVQLLHHNNWNHFDTLTQKLGWNK